jgi:aminoglycoside phosphotransferase family enzyme/predicted kinase
MDLTADNQDAVFEFLSDPANHGGREVRRIDTHAASVFLAGDRALKVKRAVRFPFLDFSTLTKRKAALEAELEINRSFAPQIYRRVLPITRGPDGALRLDGKGETVEWTLEMVRFDESRTLDRLADARLIDGGLAEKLAAAVATMHARAPVADTEAWLAAVADFVEQNTAAFRAMPALFPDRAVAQLGEASRAALERLRPLLRARGRLGLTRRGHGDLHLGNIVLLDDGPVPFDALEFDPVIASGDVLYDLAFLLMDLIERRLGRAANILLNGYFARTRRLEDHDGLAALPFLMSLRAAIRAKVTAARIERATAAEKTTTGNMARAYFDLALRLLAPPPPMLVAVGGLSGTGKSLLARALAPFVMPDPGALVLRSDVERKRLYNVEEGTVLPAEAYRPEVSATVYDNLMQQAGHVVGAGHSAVVDAVFAKAAERDAVAVIANTHHVVFRGLFLTADLETRLARVGQRVLDASDADAAVVRQQESYRLGPVDWIEIDASGTPNQTLQRARAALGRTA